MREIARRLHVSRKTVRKAIEAEDGTFSYERGGQPMPRRGAHIAGDQLYEFPDLTARIAMLHRVVPNNEV